MLQEYLKEIKEGGFIPLETVDNQAGEPLASKSLYFEDGAWMINSLNCRSSKWEGLGACNCVSHDPWFDYEISRKEALSLMREKIQEEKEDGERKQKEIAWLDNAIKELEAT